MQSSIGGGVRNCASTAYLVPLEDSRTNLDVLINTNVLRLVNVADSGEVPDMRVVELALNSTSPRVQVTASKEVVISSGFVGTPKLLTLSGIGPSLELQRLGIDPVLDSPDVGLHLKDHMLLPVYFTVNTNDTIDDLSRNQTLRQEALDQWYSSHTGPMVNSGSNTVAYLRVPENDLNGEPDPANGEGSGHVEILSRVSSRKTGNAA
jgi:choline dehydrogenase-like flavoprotein